MRIYFSSLLLLLSWCSGAFAQAVPHVDFKKDVQPLLKEYCISCHGPSQQMNGYRLDRRSSAMKGSSRAQIVPGNSKVSILYLRISGEGSRGVSMPPIGRLSDNQVEVFKNWIDQGAEWPDDAADEIEPAAVNTGATRLMDALRQDDEVVFRTELANNPASARAGGIGGSTPLMYAALYGSDKSVRALLNHGANPNTANNEGTTALMWAVDSAEKTRLLLDAGAAVDAHTESGRTALLIAAGRQGSTQVVKLLLDHGASANVFAENRTTPLLLATRRGDETAMRLLIAHGGNVKVDAAAVLDAALRSDCSACVELVIQAVEPRALGNSLIGQAQMGRSGSVKFLLGRSAAVNARNAIGFTPLMAACDTDASSVEVVQLLLDAGADVNVRTNDGKTALSLARRRNNETILDLLLKAGAKEESGVPTMTSNSVPATTKTNSMSSAIQKSLPLLQRSDAAFVRGSGCASCHNNSLTAMTVAAARKAGFAVNESTARGQLEWIARYAELFRETALRGSFNGGPDAVSYILTGMAAENYKPDTATDAFVYFLKGLQMPSGQWKTTAARPPLEYSEISTTATSIRSLAAFAPKTHHDEYVSAIRRAAAWLIEAKSYGTEERAFQLLGLKWAGVDLQRDSVNSKATALIAEQQSDGGWAPLPGMQSDAYATGQALVALHEAGALSTDSPAYKRGVQYLLQTQLDDGSWHVTTRSAPVQPYFESGFPHGKDQFISIAASNWATMALIFAVP
jgi:ankyrin repeat protein